MEKRDEICIAVEVFRSNNAIMSEKKTCQNCKGPFVIEPDDLAFYEKMQVPAPTWCPECRLVRRMVWRNEHFLFRKRDEKTGKDVFSTFPEHAPVKIYDREYWWTDEWDPLSYGREYDFSKPFFQQFKELIQETPFPSRSIINIENSDYSANANQLKNCYLVFDSNECENCRYGIGIINTRDSLDTLQCVECELSYDIFGCAKCYQTFYSSDCGNCRNVYGCTSCGDCSDCVGCIFLRNKQYCIFNEQYTKEEYFKKFKELKLNTREGVARLKKKVEEMNLKHPMKCALENHNENVTGDYISYSKNVQHSYMIRGCENCKYCHILITPPYARECMDYTTWGQGAELLYEVSQAGKDITRLKFSTVVYDDCSDISYSYFCLSSSHLFGCSDMRNKEYCILNKQYTKEEYEELVPKIIQHMNDMPYTDEQGRVYKYGEFFPSELSPFAYNETLAQEYFPLTKEQALEKGFRWSDSEEKDYTPTMSWKDLESDIQKVDKDITKEIILCRHWDEDKKSAQEHSCTKAFRITEQDLEFYKRFNIPLPQSCSYSRHFERTAYRNPMRFWHRKCQCAGEKSENGVYTNTLPHDHGTEPCPNEFETSYSPERKEIVYCKECWKREVF